MALTQSRSDPAADAVHGRLTQALRLVRAAAADAQTLKTRRTSAIPSPSRSTSSWVV